MNRNPGTAESQVPAHAAEIVREYGPFDGSPSIHGVTHDGRHVWAATSERILAIEPASGDVIRSIDRPGDAGTADRARGGCGPLQERGHQDGITRSRHDEAGEALERDRVVAHEIAQVRARGDEQGIPAGIRSKTRRAREPLTHLGRRCAMPGAWMGRSHGRNATPGSLRTRVAGP